MCRAEMLSEHELISRDEVQEDASALCPCFWKAMGGEGFGRGASGLTFRERVI